MNKSRIAIGALSTALIASNLGWAYHTVDQTVTADYQDGELRQRREALKQVLAILPAASRSDATRNEVVSSALAAAPSRHEPFEKEGYIWIGRIGLKFGADGRLADAVEY